MKKKEPASPAQEENFLSRWSKQKSDARLKSAVTGDETQEHPETSSSPDDATADREALRRLFHSPRYNERDRLDDYDEDYRFFVNLGDIKPHEVRIALEPDQKAGTDPEQDIPVAGEQDRGGADTGANTPGVIAETAVPDTQMTASSVDQASNARARHSALAAVSNMQVEPTSSVFYNAGNSLLVITGEPLAADLLDIIQAHFARPSILVVCRTETADSPGTDAASNGPECLYVTTPLNLTGHLGEFRIFARYDEQPVNLGLQSALKRDCFDVVLDLGPAPLITSRISPIGYAAVGPEQRDMSVRFAELAGLRGKFKKPKYFNYDASICAHASSGLIGCQQCLTACPADAISSVDFVIQVNPYLCQGCGTCTSVCPTGAMSYAYPRAGDTLTAVRTMLRHYLQAGGNRPCILFYESDLQQHVEPDALPDHILPCALEEIAACGMETWLSALAWGAGHVVLLTEAQSLTPAVTQQLDITREILRGISYRDDRLHVFSFTHTQALAQQLDRLAPCPCDVPAEFAALDEKRTMIFLALEHLLAHVPASPPTEITLSPGAPFGRIEVNRDQCTLCMSCASLCPRGAIAAGGDTPVLKFVESECVQCGLCEAGCPEDAIRLFPRLLNDREARINPVILNEEPVYACIRCGKPFATRKMIDTIMGKLKDHPMFQDGRLQHLQMCEDCRVKAQFDAPSNH